MHSSSSAAEEIRTLTFDDLPLAPFLKETVRSIGYVKPTPIQAEAIPLVIEGRDLIGLAQTGTGKTAAFILPILQRFSGSKEKGAKALILAPTRELAEQINDVIKELAPRTGLKSVTIYGGVSHGRQISDLRGKPQIIVACPGRLLDHMSGRTIDLSGIEVLVLDEADRMCDMGFLPDIKKIIQKIPSERQTLLFSATMPPEIQQLTNGIQNDPAIVRVKMESPVASVSHAMYQVNQKSKPAVLHHWLGENKDALVVVFTKMKHTAKRLAEQLSKKGEFVTSLHGNLSQAKRQHSLNGFKDGRFRVLIATDIAARGIDVKGITHVVNYDMPENLDAYIHRTGRAGRASATGEAVSFVTKSDTGLLRTVERWLKSPVERLETPTVEGLVDDELTTDSETRRGERPARGRQPRGPRGARTRSHEGRSRPSTRGGERTRTRGARDESAERSPASEEQTRPYRSDSKDRDSAGRGVSGRERAGRRAAQGGDDRSFERRSRSAYSGANERRGERRERGGRFEERPRRDRGFSGERDSKPGYSTEGGREGSPTRGRDGRRGDFRRGRGHGDARPRVHAGESNQRRDKGQPRDRLSALEGPDLTQVDALKVLERRERTGPPSRGSGRNQRSGFRRGGPRGGERRPQRTWDR